MAEKRISIDYGSISGGGTDVSDTTALVEDVAEGKVFHLANGESAVGTLSEVYNVSFGEKTPTASTDNFIDCGFTPSNIIWWTKNVYNNALFLEVDLENYRVYQTATNSYRSDVTSTFPNMFKKATNGFTVNPFAGEATKASYVAYKLKS